MGRNIEKSRPTQTSISKRAAAIISARGKSQQKVKCGNQHAEHFQTNLKVQTQQRAIQNDIGHEEFLDQGMKEGEKTSTSKLPVQRKNQQNSQQQENMCKLVNCTCSATTASCLSTGTLVLARRTALAASRRPAVLVLTCRTAVAS